MLDKRIQPTQQWRNLIYPIQRTCNNKLIHSATGLTPLEANKQEHGVRVNVNLNLKAKQSRKYPPVVVGDQVCIYTKKMTFDKFK